MTRRSLGAIILLMSVFALVFIVSCDPAKEFEEGERQNIEDYLNRNSTLDFVKQASGLYYLELVPGTGLSPVLNDSAYVRYTGMFLDESVFDSNVNSGTLYGFKIGENIKGFDEGITLMKAGGKAKLLIPSKLAYGAYGSSNGFIPGYTPLLFDIDLVKVVKAAGK